jgi:hypothetical protein
VSGTKNLIVNFIARKLTNKITNEVDLSYYIAPLVKTISPAFENIPKKVTTSKIIIHVPILLAPYYLN